MISYIILIAGLFILLISGDSLVKGSVNLARHLKISSLKIGLTVVAFGTSAPELFVSSKAAFAGVPDLAIGNVVGSNIANIGLIAGVIALITPMVISDKSIVKDFLVMIIASLLLLYTVSKGFISLYWGLVFVFLIILYVVHSFYFSKKLRKQNIEEFAKPELSVIKSLIYIIVSIIGLYFGAELLIKGAVAIASSWGVSERIIGVSLVAVGTSLPELTTSLIAIYRKENDISIGNLIGSNIFNIFSVLGITAVVSGGIEVNFSSKVVVDVLVSLFFALLLFVFVLPIKRGKITRMKGAVLLILYVVYLVFIFQDF